MRPKNDDLSAALEELRNRPIVDESRDYARRWEQSRARADFWRKALFGPAGVIAAACAAAYVIFGLLPTTAVDPTGKRLITTNVGETRAITLEDGSRVVLDTSSRARIAFTATTRKVELLEGQAHFEVAKEARRPFSVHTKSAEVVAVGTTFDVAALPALTTVTLIEGRVSVLTVGSVASAESRIEALEPGQQLGIANDGQLLDRKAVKIESVTAWQRGTIVLDDMPLPEALAAMNRYSTTRIVILGPQLQSRRISGVFRSGDVETEAVALRGYFGLKESSRSAGEIVLERK
jgi:transmembrane sensor